MPPLQLLLLLQFLWLHQLLHTIHFARLSVSSTISEFTIPSGSPTPSASPPIPTSQASEIPSAIPPSLTSSAAEIHSATPPSPTSPATATSANALTCSVLPAATASTLDGQIDIGTYLQAANGSCNHLRLLTKEITGVQRMHNLTLHSEPACSHMLHSLSIAKHRKTWRGHFQNRWLEQFPWLSNSAVLSGSICQYCIFYLSSHIEAAVCKYTWCLSTVSIQQAMF